MFKIGDRVKVVGSLTPRYNGIFGTIVGRSGETCKIKTEDFDMEYVRFDDYKLELYPTKEENEI